MIANYYTGQRTRDNVNPRVSNYRDRHIFFLSTNSKSYFRDGGYTLPKGTAVEEKFWIKVQCNGLPDSVHLVYDKSRTCEFGLTPRMPGYNELLKKVQEEHASLGRKTHFKAEFDGAGELIVYTHTAILLEW